MKAVVQERYGPQGDVLELQDIDMPMVGDDEVLVRVHAVSATPYGWDVPAMLRSIGRLSARVRKPPKTIPGLDLAGTVEAVGAKVRRFQPGDQVFGWCQGSMAEYRSVPDEALAMKPGNLTFEQAAAVPIAGTTALLALRDRGEVRPGQRVLIIGASGGVGTFAVQIAKAFGAEVTGVCSTPFLDLVRSIGADHVIDYTRDDFTGDWQRYDLILDMAGNRSLSELRRPLASEGTLVMVGQAGIAAEDQRYAKAMGRWLRAVVLSSIGRQRLRALMPKRRNEDLAVLKELIEDGEIAPVVTAVYPFQDAPGAIRHFEEGHSTGRVVITLSGADG